MSRSVIDQYGGMEWEITFTLNPGETPTGAGDVATLVVAQNLTGLQEYASNPLVIEIQQGSTGLSGAFAVDYNDAGGPRRVPVVERNVSRMRVLVLGDFQC